ncbi:MAG: sensor domain-containing protein [Chloroflexota bacterium]
MFKTIDEYLDALRTAMQGGDAALAQDAQSDAREHLTLALAAAREAAPNVGEAEALAKIVEEYGSPEETAAAYREVERRTAPILKQSVQPRSFPGRFFGVYSDPRTWGALLFMFIALVTGIVYFTWAVSGFMLSISLSVFIFGLPLAVLFLLSIRGLALLEGRMVEALLGERMPRRPVMGPQGSKLLERLKALITDRRTWLSLLYMILQMPLGVLYFSVMSTLLVFSVSIVVIPIFQWIFGFPTYQVASVGHYLPAWLLILIQLGGLLLLTLTMHLARGIGWLHGRYAKWMLVAE